MNSWTELFSRNKRIAEAIEDLLAEEVADGSPLMIYGTL